MQSRVPLWTLDELTAQVALALAVDYPGQPSGRVREVPDRRTVRYYTTLGLIDRPAAVRGRTALYSTRHLLQLVAIKRLQARGLPLAEIQSRLVGQTDAALRELARLPAGWGADAAARAGPADGGGDRRRAAFWGRTPDAGQVRDETPEEGAAKAAAPKSLTGVCLTDGVHLLLEAAGPL